MMAETDFVVTAQLSQQFECCLCLIYAGDQHQKNHQRAEEFRFSFFSHLRTWEPVRIRNLFLPFLVLTSRASSHSTPNKYKGEEDLRWVFDIRDQLNSWMENPNVLNRIRSTSVRTFGCTPRQSTAPGQTQVEALLDLAG